MVSPTWVLSKEPYSSAPFTISPSGNSESGDLNISSLPPFSTKLKNAFKYFD